MGREILLVNFGGPRSLQEIPSFLEALLTDREVIRTRLPTLVHNWLFRRIARKRAKKIECDYEEIGGRSPIFEDTETLAKQLRCELQLPVHTFHRYLPATHEESFSQIEASKADEILVFPLFPQFSFATTGSIAKLFCKKLSKKRLNHLRWVKSYPAHQAYTKVLSKQIEEFLAAHNLSKDEVCLLFSAHGLPQKFVDEGDLYESEVRLSVEGVMEELPGIAYHLAFQSKFGPGEWLRPYTEEVCGEKSGWDGGCKKILMVPISFTSDHIETLFEIEKLYLPLLRKRGYEAWRLDAPGRREDWSKAVCSILEEGSYVSNCMLVRCCR